VRAFAYQYLQLLDEHNPNSREQYGNNTLPREAKRMRSEVLGPPVTENKEHVLI